MRDHTKLRAFELADALVLIVYRATKAFPDDERVGLTSQMRRAAISSASNIVEGCARTSRADYLCFLETAFCFLETAYGSARELQNQCSVATRLGYLPDEQSAEALAANCTETSKVLNGLKRSLRK